MTNGDFVNGRISDKKLRKKFRENGFIQKLTIKTYSSLSKMNICYYLKIRTPILITRIISQKTEYVKTHCNDLNNPFHFACRKLFSQLN